MDHFGHVLRLLALDVGILAQLSGYLALLVQVVLQYFFHVWLFHLRLLPRFFKNEKLLVGGFLCYRILEALV